METNATAYELLLISLFFLIMLFTNNKSEEYVEKLELELKNINAIEREYAVYHEGFKSNVSDMEINLNSSNIVLAKVTAYAPHDNQSGICAENESNPITSTGYTPGYNYAAADPQRLPYGTVLFIPNYGIVEIQDTGGALRESNMIAIDVYFPTYKEAIMWGVQYLEVEVFE